MAGGRGPQPQEHLGEGGLGGVAPRWRGLPKGGEGAATLVPQMLQRRLRVRAEGEELPPAAGNPHPPVGDGSGARPPGECHDGESWLWALVPGCGG